MRKNKRKEERKKERRKEGGKEGRRNWKPVRLVPVREMTMSMVNNQFDFSSCQVVLIFEF